MASNALTGQGTVFLRNSEVISEINGIDGPSATLEPVDVTRLEDVDGYRRYIKGLKEPGTVTLNMNFTAQGYNVFYQGFNSPDMVNYEIQFPDGSLFQFSGFETELPVTVPIGDKITMDITIQISGQIDFYISESSASSFESAISSASSDSSQASSDSSASDSSEAVITGKIYPNATGYGTESRGAYAASEDPTILTVDTLDPGNFSTGTNRGTLLWACTQNFARIVVFEVSGVIDYTGESGYRIQIENPYINIYGQTAPGQGITIYGYITWFQATDMLFQHLRFRAGDQSGINPNTIDTATHYHGSGRIVFDHCSFSWSVDELTDTKDSVYDISYIDCIFAEPLDMSLHYDEGTLEPERHPYCALIRAENSSFIRNLFAYTADRNPLVTKGFNQVINNLNYNGLRGCASVYNYGDGANYMDLINNHVINIPYRGTLSSSGDASLYMASIQDSLSRFYVSGNICPLNVDDPSLTDWETVYYSERGTEATETQTDLSGLDILPADEVFDHVLDNAGAFYWNRDNIDQNVVDKVRTDAQGEFRHSAVSIGARVRNEEMKIVDGNFSAGHDWSSANETLVLSYNTSSGGSLVGPNTYTLTANCANADEVVTHLNSLLPAELYAERIGYDIWTSDMVQIVTTHVGDGAIIEVDGSSTALSTFGWTAKTFYGQTNEAPTATELTTTLDIPSDPHADSGNGYTNLEMWAYNLAQQPTASSDSSQASSASSDSSVASSDSSSSASSSSASDSSISSYALFLSQDNYVDFVDNMLGDDYSSASSNQWAVHMQVAETDISSSAEWNAILGKSTGGDGFFCLTREGYFQYRDDHQTSDYYNLSAYEETVDNYAGSTYNDIWLYCDGTDIICEAVSGTYTAAGIAETPEFSVVGQGYSYTAANNFEGKIRLLEAWDLTGYGGTFDSTNISQQTPDHRWNFNEGSGLIVYDEIGNMDGTIQTDDPNMWVAE